MQDIMRFLEEWWPSFAIVGGAILLLVIVSAVIGRSGRKNVRPVKKAEPAKTDVDPVAMPVGDEVAANSADASTDEPEPRTAEEPTTPESSQPDPAPAPAAAAPIATKEHAPAPTKVDPTPSVPATEAKPDPVPGTAPAIDTVSEGTAESATPVAEPAEGQPEPAKPKAPKPILGAYRVVYRAEDDKWIVRRDGSDRIQRTLETQTEAVHWATIKALTQDVELIVHKKDGSIRKTPGK